jgi:Sulfotransferase domain
VKLADRVKPFVSGSVRRRILGTRMFLRAPTSRLRSLPDFLLIGAMRGGTSSLYKYLGYHPDVAASLRKEIHYLTIDHRRGEQWYRLHFPMRLRKSLHRLFAKRSMLTFEATPDYIFHPYSAARAHELVPEARVIAVLRNPVSRAISHYVHNVQREVEPLPFHEALQAEPKRLSGDLERLRSNPDDPCTQFREYSYVARGLYLDQLEVWQRFYPRERLLVVGSEELYERTAETYRQILDFLELPRWEPDRFPNFDRLWRRERPKVSISDESRSWLQERFASPNRRLYEWLGRDLGWSIAMEQRR